MSKQTGFKVKAEFFLPVPKDNFADQAAAYALMADIEKTSVIPPEFLTKAALVSVSAKMSSRDAAE